MAWHVYFCARQYDEALRIILGSEWRLDPTFRPSIDASPEVGSKKASMRRPSTRAFAAALSEENPPKRQTGRRGTCAPHLPPVGRAALAVKLEFLLRDRIPDDRGRFSPIARCYMRLGKREEALQTLEKGYQLRDCPYLILWLPAHEEFDPLRSDPRFQKISPRSWHSVTPLALSPPVTALWRLSLAPIDPVVYFLRLDSGNRVRLQ